MPALLLLLAGCWWCQRCLIRGSLKSLDLGLRHRQAVTTKVHALKTTSNLWGSQMVTKLNSALGTTEVLWRRSGGRRSSLRVASLCLQRSRKAFLNKALKGKPSPADGRVRVLPTACADRNV